MKLKLYRWNGNDRRLEKPTLQEILEFGQPAAITLSLDEEQRIPEEIVLANWRCPWFSAWPGIRIYDFLKQRTYVLSEHEYADGKRTFDCLKGIVREWSTDKYHRANWFDFKGRYPAELYEGFKKLGFSFDSQYKVQDKALERL